MHTTTPPDTPPPIELSSMFLKCFGGLECYICYTVFLSKQCTTSTTAFAAPQFLIETLN
jgi:hypothetical protein